MAATENLRMYIDEALFEVAATVDEVLVFGCPDACLRPST
jgi:hypothetical protein